jgi:hypothetical protein
VLLGKAPSAWLPTCSAELALELDFFLLKHLKSADAKENSEQKLGEMKEALKKRQVSQ